MWIFTKYGFFSIACANGPNKELDTAVLMIRARSRSHLSALKERFPTLVTGPILSSPMNDYKYRVIISKENWVQALTDLAEEQTWANFKDETAHYQGKQGRGYLSALHDVWAVMLRLQR